MGAKCTYPIHKYKKKNEKVLFSCFFRIAPNYKRKPRCNERQRGRTKTFCINNVDECPVAIIVTLLRVTSYLNCFPLLNIEKWQEWKTKLRNRCSWVTRETLALVNFDNNSFFWILNKKFFFFSFQLCRMEENLKNGKCAKYFIENGHWRYWRDQTSRWMGFFLFLHHF